MCDETHSVKASKTQFVFNQLKNTPDNQCWYNGNQEYTFVYVVVIEWQAHMFYSLYI